ncbi:PD40 domain-containing protein [Occallatibacter savannae]|uniref:PD40 domain-containing protein n=1 Tax=Occallatibacter savannae TaxID=1002691 RepID=UPI000D68F33D|nr:PD40 domain-containing protein [Occallatibacter savannae]
MGQRSKWVMAGVVAGALCVPGQRAGLAQEKAGALGVFEAQSDVGAVNPPGTAKFEAGVYTVSAAGANMWAREDAFHFVWKKMSGDAALSADITFADSQKPDPHRKAVLIFRQSLDANAIYVDAAQHGSGLMGLQYRTEPSATTQDIELSMERMPKRLKLVKQGDAFTMYLSYEGEPLHSVGATTKLHLQEPFYAGIGVCSHNKDQVETAKFSNVKFETGGVEESAKAVEGSTLQTEGIEENFRRALVVATGAGRMEAPNWSKDGKTLVFNRDGKIWRIAAEGGEAAVVNTGEATKCTGSHGFSPDGKLLAISCSMPGKPETRVYVVAASGGEPKLVTEGAWSYFHGWSPDGKTIAFTRPDHKGGGNIFVIPAEGGAEKALTTGSGVSDDPDYSADGKWIYFNSDRGGSMQIWKMQPDGTGAQQVTNDEFANWTPHPSPDGQSVLILSYPQGVKGHPTNTDIALRVLNLGDGKIRTIVNVIGGAGSDNTPNWAPDGKHFAFVSFEGRSKN